MADLVETEELCHVINGFMVAHKLGRIDVLAALLTVMEATIADGGDQSDREKLADAVTIMANRIRIDGGA